MSRQRATMPIKARWNGRLPDWSGLGMRRVRREAGQHLGLVHG
jgi:hypothetical protein